MTSSSPSPQAPTPIAAVLTLTVLASIGTGVIWNGLPFIAKHEHGYSQTLNLLLYLAVGVTYIIGAINAGRFSRAAERFTSPRGVLATILVIETALCMLPLGFDGAWVLWVVGIVNALFSAVLWAKVESYLTAGRFGASMRNAIGWFNIAWTGAVAASLFFMAPLIEHHASMSIVLLGGLNAVALMTLAWFGRSPGDHARGSALQSISTSYAPMLSVTSILLPLSYLINASLAPLMPYIVEGVGVSGFWETPCTAIWMVARTVTMAVMWRVATWRGRWSPLVWGGVGVTAGFALVAWSPLLAVLVIGLVIYGVAMGVIYYAALYYQMAVGHAAVDAGGRHEALIGVGYAAGPAAGLLGGGMASISAGAISSHQGVIGVVLVVSVGMGVEAIRRLSRGRNGWSKNDILPP
jgi:MFS family permease